MEVKRLCLLLFIRHSCRNSGFSLCLTEKYKLYLYFLQANEQLHLVPLQANNQAIFTYLASLHDQPHLSLIRAFLFSSSSSFNLYSISFFFNTLLFFWVWIVHLFVLFCMYIFVKFFASLLFFTSLFPSLIAPPLVSKDLEPIISLSKLSTFCAKLPPKGC